MKLYLITADPELARMAVGAGVDRIFVDLEIHGKFDRQGHKDTVISQHSMDDVRAVRDAVGSGQLLVRVNPWHDGSPGEIDEVVAAGADDLMLPMFRHVEEVANFSQCIGTKRIKVGLCETSAGLARLNSILADGGLDEIHFGLNDLHLDMGLDFLFEVLAGGFMDLAASKCLEHGMPFGFGGVARVGGGDLPARLILGEHERLGSEAVILSRAFTGGAKTAADMPGDLDFASEVAKVRECLDELSERDDDQREVDRLDLVLRTRMIADRLGGRA
ncbi:MAG: aldolase/citrate lyase family protein [Fimbriimonadaceae bacterium]